MSYWNGEKKVNYEYDNLSEGTCILWSEDLVGDEMDFVTQYQETIGNLVDETLNSSFNNGFYPGGLEENELKESLAQALLSSGGSDTSSGVLMTIPSMDVNSDDIRRNIGKFKLVTFLSETESINSIDDLIKLIGKSKFIQILDEEEYEILYNHLIKLISTITGDKITNQSLSLLRFLSELKQAKSISYRENLGSILGELFDPENFEYNLYGDEAIFETYDSRESFDVDYSKEKPEEGEEGNSKRYLISFRITIDHHNGHGRPIYKIVVDDKSEKYRPEEEIDLFIFELPSLGTADFFERIVERNKPIRREDFQEFMRAIPDIEVMKITSGLYNSVVLQAIPSLRTLISRGEYYEDVISHQ